MEYVQYKYLLESNVSGLFPEALAGQIEPILADKPVMIPRDAATYIKQLIILDTPHSANADASVNVHGR